MSSDSASDRRVRALGVSGGIPRERPGEKGRLGSAHSALIWPFFSPKLDLRRSGAPPLSLSRPRCWPLSSIGSTGREPARKKGGKRFFLGIGRFRLTKVAFQQSRPPSRSRLQRGSLEVLTSLRTSGKVARKNDKRELQGGGNCFHPHTLASVPRSACSLDRTFAPFPPPLCLPPSVLLLEISSQSQLSAAMRRNLALVKRLLKKDEGADVTISEGGASLHHAICGNHRRHAVARTKVQVNADENEDKPQGVLPTPHRQQRELTFFQIADLLVKNNRNRALTRSRQADNASQSLLSVLADTKYQGPLRTRPL